MNFLTKTGRRIERDPYLCAFVISLVILLLYSVIQGIFPFGRATFLRKDLYHQYLPFLYELRRRLISGQSLKYSFDLGLGSSFYVLYVYYLSDPLNFLSVLVPEDFVLEFLTIITFLKIAAASSFMCRYLRFRYPDTSAALSVLLSLCYGFSGYIASYDWNVMWMWGIALAPLVMMGFEKMLKGEGSGLYLICFSFMVWTNYYIAMVMGIFLVIYFFIITIENNMSILSVPVSAFRTAIVTAVSVGIPAVLLLPEWEAIKNTSFTGKSFPDRIKFYLSVPELMTRSLMSVRVETGLGHEPALYASLAMLFIIPLFFLSKRIPVRMKLTRGFLLLFFYLSFDTNMLEFIWHGFNYPDSIPARQAFLFVIVILTCACAALDGVADAGDKRLIISSAFPVIFYIICIVFCRNEEHTDIFTWVLNALFILMYLLLAFVVIRSRNDPGKPGITLFAAILLFELVFNFNMTSLRDVSRESYFKHKASYKALAEEAAEDDILNGGLFVRLDTADEKIRNVSSLVGYHDLSLFSSTIERNIIEFYKNFGMKASRVHYMGEGLTPFTSAIMGAGYVLANDVRNNQTDSDVASLIDEKDEDYLYKNRYCLPFGYTIPKGHYELYPSDDSIRNPLYIQNAAAVRLGGNEIFVMTDDDCIYEEEGRAVIEIPEEGHYYAWTDANVGQVTEYKDFDDDPYAEFKDMKYESVMDLGQLDKGCSITLECKEQVYPGITLCRFDPDNMRELTDRLMQDSFILTEFEDDHIEATVNVSEGRQLLLTVPVSDGWEIILDETEKTYPDSFYGMFMVLPMSSGSHHISLSYHIPGFIPGLSITVISFLAAVIIILIEYRFLLFIEKTRIVLDQVSPKARACPAKPDYCGQNPISSAISHGFKKTENDVL